MPLRSMLSQSVEDYLKAIYKLQAENPVSTTDLAEKLNITAASVTNMAKRLSSLGLVTYAPYKGVRLTESGEQIALEIIRHHRLLETYLRQIMGYDWDEMHDEAEHLEHHISEEFEDRLDKMLGYPTHDPHGDPIPGRDGTIISIESHPVTSFPEGVELTIRRVSDSNVDMLRKLESMGLLPGATCKLISKSEDTLEVVTSQNRFELDAELASHVFATESTKTDFA
ncbi:MAG TPA: DtxR family transcriptional regulator [Bacteroidetes bacterium]|nr:DtxR family transcriptional regulator [Bacteroidota bacterium]